MEGEAEQGRKADPADHAVDDGHSEIELGPAGTVDKGEGHGPGARAEEVQDHGQRQHHRTIR